MLIHTDENKFEEIIKNKKLCLVDFFATWCGPCIMLGEELKIVANKSDEFDVIKVDIDQNPNLANEYEIEVVPTMYVFKNGKPVQQIQGYVEHEEILRLMQGFLTKE